MITNESSTHYKTFKAKLLTLNGILSKILPLDVLNMHPFDYFTEYTLNISDILDSLIIKAQNDLKKYETQNLELKEEINEMKKYLEKGNLNECSSSIESKEESENIFIAQAFLQNEKQSLSFEVEKVKKEINFLLESVISLETELGRQPHFRDFELTVTENIFLTRDLYLENNFSFKEIKIYDCKNLLERKEIIKMKENYSNKSNINNKEINTFEIIKNINENNKETPVYTFPIKPSLSTIRFLKDRIEILKDEKTRREKNKYSLIKEIQKYLYILNCKPEEINNEGKNTANKESDISLYNNENNSEQNNTFEKNSDTNIYNSGKNFTSEKYSTDKSSDKNICNSYRNNILENDISASNFIALNDLCFEKNDLFSKNISFLEKLKYILEIEIENRKILINKITEEIEHIHDNLEGVSYKKKEIFNLECININYIMQISEYLDFLKNEQSRLFNLVFDKINNELIEVWNIFGIKERKIDRTIEGLEFMKKELKNLNTKKESFVKVLDLIHKRKNFVEKMLTFEKVASDPKRLFKSSFQLLNEEKFRKSAVPNLLKIEEELKRELEAFESKYGIYVYNGKNYKNSLEQEITDRIINKSVFINNKCDTPRKTR
ncbi:hypothetical protein LUQ84_003088 [Hamiltosporidium tvaerminnensis]|nr:hypothetical protein LUQ84_003088 [Hamiltosporidium tvaerminnensis]